MFSRSILSGLSTLFVLVNDVLGAQLTTVTNWGNNPSGISSLQVYVPDTLAASPAIILGVSHHLMCQTLDQSSREIATPMWWYWLSILLNDPAAPLRRSARLCPALPIDHQAKQLLGRPFLSKLDTQWRR